MRRALALLALVLSLVNCHTTIVGCLGAIVCHNYPPPKSEPRSVPRIYLW